MRMMAGLLAGLALMAGPVLAQEAAVPGGVADKMAKRMKAAPEAFLEDAAGLILGYGTDGRIDRAGIDRAIAVDRAEGRAAEMRRMMLADLDGNGAADPAEIAVLVQAAAAKGRGRVLLAFEAADADRDGTVTPAEMAARSVAAGVKAVSPGKVAALQGLMALDADADGMLTLDEVRAAVKKAQDAA